MSKKIVVAGVGMIPFKKPGVAETYPVMGAQAVRIALADAGVGYESIQQAFASYIYGDSTAGQRPQVSHILRAGQQLLALINEVLDIARIEAGRLPLNIEPIALATVISSEGISEGGMISSRIS